MQGGKKRNKKGQFAKRQYIPPKAYLASITFWLAILSIPIIILTLKTPDKISPSWEEVFTEEQIQEAHAMWRANQIPSVKDPASLDTVSYATLIPKEAKNNSQGQIEGNKSNLATATVTAYTSEPSQTDSSPCISADGSNICNLYAQGELICATNDLPLGSHAFIGGYGTCTIRDRMNSRYTGTGRIDIYFGHDTQTALNWGIQTIPFDWSSIK